MQYVRIVPREHWDTNKKRFTTLAFKPSSDDGISVIEKQCLSEISASVCDHIRKYYPHISGEPPIFWEFPDNILPPSVRFIPIPSDRGDLCHRDVSGLSEKEARKIFKGVSLEEFSVCTNGNHRGLRVSDLP